jgi:hypothetical protein
MPSSEERKIGVFLGRWRTTGEVAATASSPAMKVDSIDTNEWYPGEFFQVHHANGDIGEQNIKSIEIMDTILNGNAITHLFSTAPAARAGKKSGSTGIHGHGG